MDIDWQKQVLIAKSFNLKQMKKIFFTLYNLTLEEDKMEVTSRFSDYTKNLIQEKMEHDQH